MFFANNSVPVINTVGLINNFNISLDKDNQEVKLHIVEEPEKYFRYRYRSEMQGTHGCLLGKHSNKEKKYPTVELINYNGKAVIKCSLVHHDRDEKHPHKISNDDLDEVCIEVPEHDSYTVCFRGLSIIHSAKKEIVEIERRKNQYRFKNPNDLNIYCENILKSTNMNKVRLKFSAHNIDTDKEICGPVFSESINNKKSVDTNDLKICRMSLMKGQPSGGDEVYLLVEKINWKNVVIRFYELKNNTEIWHKEVPLFASDVHHQYAIVFRTPPYRDPNITKDVKVYLVLAGVGTDNRRSEPFEFIYTPKPSMRLQINKRKASHSLSSTSSHSLNSNHELPAIFDENHIDRFIIYEDNDIASKMDQTREMNSKHFDHSKGVLAEAMTEEILGGNNPVLSSGWNSFQLRSSEIENLLNDNPMHSSEYRNFLRENFKDSDDFILPMDTDHLEEYFATFYDKEDKPNKDDFKEFIPEFKRLHKDSPYSSDTIIIEEKKKGLQYTASYSIEDGKEVQKLVKDLRECINIKDFARLRTTLEKLVNIRLVNGDTFLHMMMHQNQSAFRSIIEHIQKLKLNHLLNLANHKGQTILHLAIANNLVDIVKYLMSKGCDPLKKDLEGNDAVEYVVKYNLFIAEHKTERGKEKPINQSDRNTKSSTVKTAQLQNRPLADSVEKAIEHNTELLQKYLKCSSDNESIKSEPDDYYSANRRIDYRQFGRGPTKKN